MSADDAGSLPDLVAGRLSTAVVPDILDDLGHRDHVLDPVIRPLGDATVIAGWANPFLVAEVVADADGGVVVPARLAAEAVGRALDKVSKENRVRDALAGGSTLRSAYDRFGVL